MTGRHLKSTRRLRRLAVIAAVVASSAFACIEDSGNERSLESAQEWVARTFRDEGIALLQPSRACFALASASKVSVNISPIEGSKVVDDLQCTGAIVIDRMTARELTERPGIAGSAAALRSPDLWQWTAAEHRVLSTHEHGRYIYFRRDLPCPNGDIVWMHGSVLRDVAADEAARDVRKVLNSVRCWPE